MNKTLLVCELDRYALPIINYAVGTGNSKGKALHYMQVRKKERKKERNQPFSRFTQAYNTSTLPTFDSIYDAMCYGWSKDSFHEPRLFSVVWFQNKIVCVPTWSFKQRLMFWTLGMNVLLMEVSLSSQFIKLLFQPFQNQFQHIPYMLQMLFSSHRTCSYWSNIAHERAICHNPHHSSNWDSHVTKTFALKMQLLSKCCVQNNCFFCLY